jgi:hypothetical protein
MNSRKIKSLASIAVLGSVLPILAVAPADADPGDPSPGQCSVLKRTQHPTATTIRFVIKVTCNRRYVEMENGVTVQHGDWSTTARHVCRRPDSNPIKRCTTRLTYPDPAGRQHWMLHDEYYYTYMTEGAGDHGMYTIKTYS